MTVDEVLEHYLAAALWTATDEEGDPLDNNYDLDDLSWEARRQARERVEDFLRLARLTLPTDWEEHWRPEQVGHDLLLTSQRQGAGFWDRGLPYGDQLTGLAHTFSDPTLYVGEDDLLYFL